MLPSVLLASTGLGQLASDRCSALQLTVLSGSVTVFQRLIRCKPDMRGPPDMREPCNAIHVKARQAGNNVLAPLMRMQFSTTAGSRWMFQH